MSIGSSFLKIVSILMIAAGALSIVLSVLSGGAGFLSLHFGGGGLFAAGILSLIGALLELASGIVGLIFNRTQMRVIVCAALGLAALIVNFAGLILTYIGYSGTNVSAATLIPGIVLSLAIPGLFFAGVFYMRKTGNRARSA